jgi:beta-alanine--pyruvate transaminase
MGAVMVRKPIYDAMMNGPEGAIELAHGYTYSAHPLATAAALATLDVYRDDRLFERARDLAPYWETALHGLKGARHVIDVRNIGLVGAVEFEPRPGQALKRGYEVFTRCFAAGVLVRQSGDAIALSPPLIIERHEIDRLVETLRATLDSVD